MTGVTIPTDESGVAAIALDELDASNPEIWRTNSHKPYFDRLRREDPVHYTRESAFGPYWSVTRYADIMAVDTNHKVFSSKAEFGGITIYDTPPSFTHPNFQTMDPPDHAARRNAVAPIVSPPSLARLEGIIRERASAILDNLPRGEVFDWVDRVSIELTSQMLSILLGFPFEDRRRLTWWSDVTTTIPGPGQIVESVDEKRRELTECLEIFTRIWKERAGQPPTGDMISMLVHSPATQAMSADELMGTLQLLIVGGNDTTRNSISGSLFALNRYPEQYEMLRADPALIPSMINEAIRWQTPLSHMRRTALQDFEIGGKEIRKGDKVVMWYVSGNRDEEVFDRADDFIINRDKPRPHLSFGFGIHRCVGNRIAETQLRVVWEEILKRFPVIELAGEPEYAANPFVKGYLSLPVRIPT